MLSFRSTVLAVAALYAGVATADYVITPSSVPLSLREFWCSNEKSTCPIICQQFEPGTTLVNNCDPVALTYGCLCGNNKQPNVSEYSLTLPYYVCQEWGNQCVKACNGDASCGSACLQDHPCGAQHPTTKKKGSSTTGTASATAPASSTASDTTIFTGTPGGGSDGSDSDSDSDSAGSGKKGAAAALEVGRAYGLAVVVGSMFVGFAML